MHIKFLTLAELAEAAGFTAAESDMFFTELVNDPHSLVRPYVMTTEGIPMPIGRQALGAMYYFNQDDVRVKEDDVDEYVEMRARVISAKPADDAKGYPVDFVGRPDFTRFLTGDHIVSWLANGGSLTSDDIDQEINARLMEIIESEAPE